MELTEILKSGDINVIVVGENIRYLAADQIETEGMFLRIGLNGFTTLYRAPNQDITWEDTDTSNRPLSTTPLSVLSVTVDQDITPENGSFQIAGQLDNGNNQDRTVTVEVLNAGIPINSQEVNLIKNETGKVFVFSGPLQASISSGSTLTVEFTSSGSNVALRGDVITTSIAITKAQAAPV